MESLTATRHYSYAGRRIAHLARIVHCSASRSWIASARSGLLQQGARQANSTLCRGAMSENGVRRRVISSRFLSATEVVLMISCRLALARGFRGHLRERPRMRFQIFLIRRPRLCHLTVDPPISLTAFSMSPPRKCARIRAKAIRSSLQR